MKEINAINALECNHVITLAGIVNSQTQYDQESVILYQVGKAIIYKQYIGCETTTYLLNNDFYDEISLAKTDPLQWLTGNLHNFDFGDFYQIEQLRWGISTIEDIEAVSGDNGPFKIIKVGFCSGYDPIDYVLDDGYNILEFSTYSDAKAWTDEAGKGNYYLGNNEFARPDYYIVSSI